MINPKLSRRIAKVSETMMKNGMTFEDKRELYKILNKTESFDNLPDKFRNMILDAESSIQKLNYKCKKGTKNPDTNECAEEKEAKISTSKKIQNKDSELNKIVKFKPAKDTKSAEKFAYDMILEPKSKTHAEEWNSGKIAHTTPDKVQQIKIISYRGIDTKVANIINEQIVKNINLGLPRPSRILATQMRKSPNTLMSMSTSSGELLINTIAVGNFKKIDVALDAGRKLNGQVGKDALKTLEEHKDKMNDRQKRIYNDIKETLKYSRGCVGYEVDSTPERALQATLNHEAGHMLENYGKYAYDTPQHDEFREVVYKIAKITKDSEEYRYKLSSYGCKDTSGIFNRVADPHETFAEVYAAYRFNEDDNIHPDALKLLKQYLPER